LQGAGKTTTTFRRTATHLGSFSKPTASSRNKDLSDTIVARKSLDAGT